MSSDPTAFDIQFDPFHQRMSGFTVHGNTYFDTAFMSQITDDLWTGGCERGLVLPEFITDVVSLYRWERYTVGHPIRSFVEVTMYDSADKPNEQEVFALADWVIARRAMGGKVLVHCQAGLNRSGLVAATALVRSGEMSGREAIQTLKEKRCDAVLCNPTFHEWVWNLDSP